MNRRIRRVFIIFLLISLLLQLLSCSGGEGGGIPASDQTDGVSSVLLNRRGDKLTVSCLLGESFLAEYPRATLALFELQAGSDGSDLGGLDPVASFRAASKLKYSDELTNGALTRLYSSYLLALKNSDGSYTAVGSPVPILNPGQLAGRTFDYPEPISIKGIESDSISDALSLGVSHCVIDISIEDYIALPDPNDQSPDPTVSLVFNGITYHFDTDAVAALDARVRTLSDEGVIVYLRFLLSKHPDALPEKIKCLGYAGAPSAENYAINIYNPDCSGYVASLFELLAERYTRPDRNFGFCGAFIIGYEVNNSSVSNAAATDSNALDYASAYERLLRVAHTALVSNYSKGRVYISLGNNWNAEPSSAYAADSSASSFLSNLSVLSKARGDYNWGIAASAYPLDRQDSSIWDDALATGASSQYLSPANISVLTYALSKNYTYTGGMRNLIISSFGVSGNPSDTSSLNAQAASYAYAYYKIASDSDVDALIYVSVDDPRENTGSGTAANTSQSSPKYGLRTPPTGDTAGGNKPIWSVFASIDSKNDAAALSAASLAGSEFNYLYNNLNASLRVRRTHTGEGTLAGGSDKYQISPLFDFSRGSLYSFRAATPLSRVDLAPADGKPALRVLGSGDAGIIASGIAGELLAGHSNLLVNISNGGSDGKLTLRLTQRGKGGYISYESTAGISTGVQTVTFDLADFAGAISKEEVNLSLYFTPESGEASELLISSLSAADKSTTAPPVLMIIFITLAVILGLLLAIALFSRFYHKMRRRSRRSRRGDFPGNALTPRDGN